jgi:DNA-binding MarR family transcriptional regulator
MKQRAGILRQLGLSLSEYAALRLCAEAPSMLSTIADVAGVTSAGATDIVDRLEARRLVRRVSDPSDRRAVRVSLTPAGRRLFREAQSAQRTMFRELSRSLSPSDREALVTGLSSLIRSLSSHES